MQQAIDFLEDNLRFTGLDPETQVEVRESRPAGALVRTMEGWPIVTYERGGQSYVLDGPLHHELIDRLGRDPASLVIVFGLGNGNAIRALRAAKVDVALVFEPDPGLLRSFLEQGPSDLGELSIVTNQRELETLWTRVVGDRDNVVVTDTPGYDKAFSAERLSLTSKIADLLERNLVNEQTLRARGRIWIEDIIQNASYIPDVPSAHHLQGAYRNVPAFIVGAGPSLSKNVHLLEEAGRKGIVFAVNSSGKALDKAGIRPQILACLESIDVTHLIRDLSFIDDVARVFSLTAHPALFATGKGPLMTLYELLPHVAGPFETLFGRPGLPVCGSVSTACFSLAYRMGCSPIVLVGQDLAYTNGRCYADGTPYEESRVEFSQDGTTLRHDWCSTMVETHEGQKNELLPGQKTNVVSAWGGEGSVTSAGTFNHVRSWLERVATLLEQSGGPELINATEGGARIENFSERTLESVLEGLPSRSISSRDIVEQARRGGPLLGQGDVVNLFRSTEKGAQAVATAARVLAGASRAAEAEFENPDPSVLSRLLRQLQYAEAELRTVVHRWPWVDAWAWESVDESLEPIESDVSLSESLRGIRAEGRLAEAIMSSALELAERLRQKHLELRDQTSESESPASGLCDFPKEGGA